MTRGKILLKNVALKLGQNKAIFVFLSITYVPVSSYYRLIVLGHVNWSLMWVTYSRSPVNCLASLYIPASVLQAKEN